MSGDEQKTRWRRRERKRGQGWREGAEDGCISLKNLGDVLGPSGEQFTPRTRVNTGQHFINIVVSCSIPRTAVCTNYSAQGRKCVVATAMGALHNTIDHNLSAPACAECTPMCFLSPG